MGLTANVVAGATIQSAWGNQIRDRTLQVFADPTERDAQWTNPPDGAHCLTLNQLGVWVRASGVWVPLAADGRPIGMLTLAANGASDDTTGVLVGATFTFTLPAARCVGISMDSVHQRSSAAGLVSSFVTIDGRDTRCGRTSRHDVLGGTGQSADGVAGVFQDLAAGAHNARFKVRSTSGGATANLLAGSWFTIADAGPNLNMFPFP